MMSSSSEDPCAESLSFESPRPKVSDLDVYAEEEDGWDRGKSFSSEGGEFTELEGEGADGPGYRRGAMR
jgi:hypothetical protein